ncbi:MAG TPA: helix-turn-helix domain-containing protein [Burkholderiales bacterium]|nr:helix-turn-helix domain-containing protein [Burkholderiales bacterium]
MTKNPRIPPCRVVEVVAFPGAQLLDVAGPLQVFASANDALRAAGRPPAYAVRVVAESSPVPTSSGLCLVVRRPGAAGGAIDTLIVSGGAGVHEAARDRRLLTWLRRRATRAKRVASVCSGAWLLAAAGLLDGRRAVTHWDECGALAHAHPKVRVEVDPIFIEDGKVWTSAGVTAGIDMSLAMVERDVGHAVAIAVARDLVVFLKRPGGQSQFSTALSLQHGDDRLDRLHGWIAGNLAADLSVPALAARAGMSERTFLRYYAAATGRTPARAVESLRVEAARQLLATTRVPVKRVAARCGFGSEETMRRSLLRQAGVTPGEYRARFSSAGPATKAGNS